jgi:L-lactate dehydrogenase (cytochrome)
MAFTEEEVSLHNNRSSCWVIIRGEAYDMTDFLTEHPAGPEIILKYAGRDATEEFV